MNKQNLLLFVCLVFLNFLSFCTYGIPITYFPKVATDRGLHDYAVGMIFSMYPLFAFIFSFIVGKMLKKWNKKWIVRLSQLLLGCATLLFGFSYMFPYMSMFVVFAIIGRSLQGLSIGAYQTAAYAYIPEFWPDEIDQRICCMEISVAFGIGMGPIISSMIYSMGYVWIYIIPSIIIIVLGSIISVVVLPAKGPLTSMQLIELEKDVEVISVKQSLCNKDMLYTFFSVVMNFTSFTLIMPGFELKILEMDETPEIGSVIFAFVQVGYGLGCGILLIFTLANRRGVFFLGILFNIFGLWMLGIDEIFSMTHVLYLVLMGVGLFIVGLTCAMTMIPNFSENISILKKIFPNHPEDVLINMSSGIFTAAISLAEFQGPIIGGVLSDFYGFSKCCLYFSFAVMAFFLLFTFHFKGYEYFGKFIWPDPEGSIKSLRGIDVEINTEKEIMKDEETEVMREGNGKEHGEKEMEKEKDDELASLNG